ncbi:MAG TPA: glyceraldehyde 3-phosphate dehydrogenase NAD-binding domain-containing protein [Spirochaetota bacterium]|nr:glyceraldehyde 3-phosphate dehydrogenase NAD-binding domain-containing protein [Spirochaetota bacterium]HPI89425.1 glyceraldehyde 3-phosphate dehydrogenase NAD-binding domain-containing protein [Spirochaetota bacterium]HPR46907.1 glyceraldehyde 3-phosphate dehydrogenase NAD-binding domain-containing protein [Spirochaetota bacterium]
MSDISFKSPVGVNGIGRIGKLLVWILSARKEQEQIVISTGREIGKSLEDLATYMSYDSTYGTYEKFLFGFQCDHKIEIKGDNIYLNGMKLVWINDPKCRVPGSIPWAEHGVEVVFETTGKMTDPTVNDDNALRGHLNHSKKVILTAPFKIKNKGTPMPEDAVTVVGGVNMDKYDGAKHRVISNASCTTNCCAPPIKALVDHFGDRFISYSLTTVHASTNSQAVLDTLPKTGDKDTRKRRSILNNIIPTTTGAANAVIEVIPEIREIGIGSQASALRVPTNTASIVIMDVSVIGEYDNLYVHDIFKKYSEKYPGVMKYSTQQLVSSDIIGNTYSTIYDSLFTHHRTSKRGDQYYTMFDLNFWYDNEFGYVNSMMRLYDTITGR